MTSTLDQLRRLSPILEPGQAGFEAYLNDRSVWTEPAAPLAVALPESTAQVSAVVAWCAEHGLPVIPRGAGSGVSGGATARAGSVVVSVERMDQILEIDQAKRQVRVQPGLINADLRRVVEPMGLFYPPDPASLAESSIGGNIATNAGGLFCLKYGVTRDYVISLEVVIGTGEVLRLRREVSKDVMGYDLASLVVGSEGTLGIVTEATLRLIPLPSDPVATVMGRFDAMEPVGRAIEGLFQAGLDPIALEFVDPIFMDAVARYNQTAPTAALDGPADPDSSVGPDGSDGPGRAGAVRTSVLIAQIAMTWPLDDPANQGRKTETVFRQAGARTVEWSASEAEADRLMADRRLCFTALSAEGPTVSEDVSVPRTELGRLLVAIERVADRHGLVIGTMGHAGDGNLHPCIPIPPGPDGDARAQAAFEDIMRQAILLGGSVTGEHGVGLLKAEAMRQALGPTQMALHRAIKAAFDPAGILNPGKMLA
ncbi:MAG: FAD-binding protein [Propionibacteriaceae bacterium]|jgi:glycolate oxidase|nr:FAD-binding protein [Propionibacteriaceae bacterium]